MTVRSTGILNVRAVQKENGKDIRGFVRISNCIRGIHRIEGICAEFEASGGFQDIFYRGSQDSSFFYGMQGDLIRNYRNQEKANSMMSLFQQNIVYCHKNGEDSSGNTDIEFARIPVKELGLTNEQGALIRSVMRYTSFLLKRSSRVRLVYVPEKPNALRALVSNFSRTFPKDLLDAVIEKGKYWDLTKSMNLKQDEFLDHQD